MIWLELVVAAFGGGVIATMLELWITHLRAYETARLQVLDDLDSINAMSGAIDRLVKQHGDAVTMEELGRMSYPTRYWASNRAVMATRLARKDPGLLQELSSLFAALRSSPYPAPLQGDMLTGLPRMHKRLAAASVGRFGIALVYGPGYAIHWHKRRAQGEVKAPTSGAHTGAQEP